MAMMPETRAALARYDEWAARVIKSPDQLALTGKRIERKTRSVGRRLRNMLLGAFAVVLGGFLYGLLIAPLGFIGVMLAVLGALLVMVFLAGWPKEREPTLDTLPEVPLKALPAQLDDWLEGQRRLLPPPAARDVDLIMAQLERLSPELARLKPDSALADDARRLIGDHLPRLVRTYSEVPATHRATPEATTRLREGLHVVSEELERITTSIAKDGLNALEIEGRFLESRYKGSVGGKSGGN